LIIEHYKAGVQELLGAGVQELQEFRSYRMRNKIAKIVGSNDCLLNRNVPHMKADGDPPFHSATPELLPLSVENAVLQ
jgi:hypothetical protein